MVRQFSDLTTPATEQEDEMDIKRVKFERLFNFGNYEHIKIGLEADVSNQSDLPSLFKSLNEKCEQEFSKIEKAKELAAQKENELNDLYWKCCNNKEALRKMFAERGNDIPF